MIRTRPLTPSSRILTRQRSTCTFFFYIWLPDRNGRKVVEALLRAAQRGVTCRVIDNRITYCGSQNCADEDWRIWTGAALTLTSSLFDPHLTQDIRRRQETYIAQSKPVSQRDVAAWRLHHQLCNNVMAILSPVL